MVTKIISEKNGISLRKFKKDASRWYPGISKIFYRNGKAIARYSAKTKRIKIL